MFTRDPETHLDNFCFRLPAAMKREIQRLAAERSSAEGRTISPGELVRELLEGALAASKVREPNPDQLLHDEVMACAFFARRAFEIFLEKHKGLAEKLLRASRAEVQQRRGGRAR